MGQDDGQSRRRDDGDGPIGRLSEPRRSTRGLRRRRSCHISSTDVTSPSCRGRTPHTGHDADVDGADGTVTDVEEVGGDSEGATTDSSGSYWCGSRSTTDTTSSRSHSRSYDSSYSGSSTGGSETGRETGAEVEVGVEVGGSRRAVVYSLVVDSSASGPMTSGSVTRGTTDVGSWGSQFPSPAPPDADSSPNASRGDRVP